MSVSVLKHKTPKYKTASPEITQCVGGDLCDMASLSTLVCTNPQSARPGAHAFVMKHTPVGGSEVNQFEYRRGKRWRSFSPEEGAQVDADGAEGGQVTDNGADI